MSKARQKIIIDTDPGQDDAVAILLALGSPELEILGITAVAGNVPLTLTEKNARKICELAGRPDVKVFAGAVRPLIRPLVTAEDVHGKTGLDGPDSARADDAAAGAACASISSSRRCWREPAGDRHAVRARAAHQHRAGADPRADDR